MTATPEGCPNVTELLLAWRGGEDQALHALVEQLHGELRRTAQRYMAGEKPDHTLQATALVHEVYLRLLDTRRIDWQNRAHFMAMAARLMRRVLVDAARARKYQKRGGGAVMVTFDEALPVTREPALDVIVLDDALEALATVDPRKAAMIELRFFAGLNVEETAAVLGVSPDTVHRDWRLAKAWLAREMREQGT